jgi:hypothetical protein
MGKFVSGVFVVDFVNYDFEKALPGALSMRFCIISL